MSGFNEKCHHGGIDLGTPYIAIINGAKSRGFFSKFSDHFSFFNTT